MTNVVDRDLISIYEEEARNTLTKVDENDTSNNDEFKEKQEEYVAKTFGENARIDGNKVVDEKGEVIREFTDEDAWIDAMVAAEATEKAAAAMEKIPGIIKDVGNIFSDTFEDSTELMQKAFTDGADVLTKGELTNFE
jgi:23S rRNA A1618 N6-methylase RlmF